jgi:hypothetical protein
MPTTQWETAPSLTYEALCFVNVLTGDPFYTPYYQAEYDHWLPRLTPEVTSALAHIHRTLKVEGGQIISAQLCLLFSQVPDLTLNALVAAVAERTGLHQSYQQSQHYQEEDWLLFEQVWQDLQVVFAFLLANDFEGYWRHDILPQITPRMAELRPILPSYDIVPQVERYLGYRLGTSAITAYLVHFTKPHGISIAEARFITSPAWPAETNVRTAIHEMMHPPFDRHDQHLRQLIETLRQDAFVMSRFTDHNPSFGYNTLEGLIEEDCVQALDQMIGERFGVARDPRERWRQADEGLHVFAVALYTLMRRDGYGTQGYGIHSQQGQAGTFQDNLIHALQTTLRPGQIEFLSRAGL